MTEEDPEAYVLFAAQDVRRREIYDALDRFPHFHAVSPLDPTLLVTVHALVHKRDTASCTGWIGICWIAPLMGTVLYLMFGINRVRRRAQKMVNRHLWEGRDPLAQYRQTVDGDLAPLSKCWVA